jgi:hypothetical protein
MLSPALKQQGGTGGSVSDNSDSSSLLTKSTKKSVRFSSDASRDHHTAERSAWLAAQAAAGSSGGDRGNGSFAATVAGRGTQHDGADGKGSSGSGGTAAGPHDEADEDAIDAERHGLLPSWRLKMPVVEWCARLCMSTCVERRPDRP